MSFSSKLHTMFHTFCTSSIHLAKGVDHVPVSHHAAVAALSTASHYSTCLDWPVHATECSNLPFHRSTPPGKLHSNVCMKCAWTKDVRVCDVINTYIKTLFFLYYLSVTYPLTDMELFWSWVSHTFYNKSSKMFFGLWCNVMCVAV